ncbi:branched-chain amino acid ABC transporter permease [Alicyclobacillus sp. ALC3]|uniref:branched-chain amino acid ABC transporter permease n=1 Tax=Alicyclobacillus sp. ALC3 TaxID=2796143 RepID=UPI002377E8DB|nr:branched-chain amino acid ABC transporter permease [Alicyclobacillus sp. ALC3]WDL97576.1 branched-chain amino acid ABC transporter permease [Alicyclobacillus sp. ALC3]
MNLHLVIEAIIMGILTGGVYALMASGLTLIFGVMDIINVGQGALVVMGAYLSYALEQLLHVDLMLGLLITMPLMFIFGVAIQWVLIRPLKKDRTMLSIMVTFGLALLIEGVLGAVFSTNFVQLQAWYTTASVDIAGIHVAYIYIFTFGLAVIFLSALYFVLYKTRFGQAIRASMQNRTAAQLIGINVEWVQAVTFGLGTALAAAGGMAFGAVNAFDPGSSYDLISRLLVVIILGGMGSLSGAMIASLIMLTVEDFIAVAWSPVWSTLVFFAILVIVMLVRPQGMFGRPEGRKQ